MHSFLVLRQEKKEKEKQHSILPLHATPTIRLGKGVATHPGKYVRSERTFTPFQLVSIFFHSPPPPSRLRFLILVFSFFFTFSFFVPLFCFSRYAASVLYLRPLSHSSTPGVGNYPLYPIHRSQFLHYLVSSRLTIRFVHVSLFPSFPRPFLPSLFSVSYAFFHHHPNLWPSSFFFPISPRLFYFNVFFFFTHIYYLHSFHFRVSTFHGFGSFRGVSSYLLSSFPHSLTQKAPLFLTSTRSLFVSFFLLCRPSSHLNLVSFLPCHYTNLHLSHLPRYATFS